MALEVKSRASCGRQALCQLSSISIPHQYTFKTQCMLQIHYLEKTSTMHLQATQNICLQFSVKAARISCLLLVILRSGDEGTALLCKQRSHSHICLDLLSVSVNQHSANCVSQKCSSLCSFGEDSGSGQVPSAKGKLGSFYMCGKKIYRIVHLAFNRMRFRRLIFELEFCYVALSLFK